MHYKFFMSLRTLLMLNNNFLAMPELLRSAKLAIEKGQSQGRDVSYLKFLSDSIIPALVEALHKVNHHSRLSILDSFNVEFVCDA